jgi:membrane protease subunit HflK
MSDEHTPGVSPVPDAEPRPGSVTLRESAAAGDDSETMERANRSALAALNTAYALLGVIMVGLVVLFLFSGFQSVGESERAVRLRFGAIVDRNLGPGVHLAWPAPFGELVTVPFGQQQLRIDDAFFPALRENQRRQTIEQLSASFKSKYNPAEDGSLLTADRNLAHVRVEVSYQRKDPTLWVTNIDRRDEQDIIRLTVERAVVRAVSEVGIDDIVKMTPGAEGSVAGRARSIAQGVLDGIGSGIEILRLDLNDPGPPLTLYRDFAAVTSATANANAARESAQQDARTQLSALAGDGAEPLIALINRYERAIDLSDSDAQAALLGAIDRALLGEAVTVTAETDGLAEAETMVLPAGAVSGEITVIIGDAVTDSREARDSAQADLAAFRARLPLYRDDPGVLIASEWSRAFAEFLGKPTVQAMFVPPGTDTIDLDLNRDPKILREQEKARNQEELRRAQEEREKMIRAEELRLRDTSSASE